MARASDVDKMSYAELAAMEKQIEKLKIEKQNTERLELRQKLVDEAKKHGFDIHELFGRRGRRGTVAPKYRDRRTRRIPGQAVGACPAGWQPPRKVERRRRKTS